MDNNKTMLQKAKEVFAKAYSRFINKGRVSASPSALFIEEEDMADTTWSDYTIGVENIYNQGVFLDLLHYTTSASIRDRVNSIRRQLVANKYMPLNMLALQLLTYKEDYIAQYGLRPGTKAPTLGGQRYHLLCKTPGFMVLTYRYANAKWEVEVALKAGRKVMVFSPYKEEDLVAVKTLAQWEAMLEEEANPHQATWAKELEANLATVMDTPTPWLECQSLHELAGQFKQFSHFMEYVEAQTSIIEELGEWDVETTTSVVYNEKASVAKFVNKQGFRDVKSAYKYGNKEYWENYEVLPVDVLTKYLHLSYLMSIDYKPLVRMFTEDDVLMLGKEVWLGSCVEDMVRSTPIYLDVNDPQAMELYNQFVNENKSN